MGRKGGFSPLEITALVASLLLLTAMAVPTYQSHTLRVHRQEAHDFLELLGARQQYHYRRQGRFADDLDALGMTVPDDLERRYRFRLELEGDSAGAVTLSAHPRPDSPQEGDDVLQLRADAERIVGPVSVQNTP